MNAVSQSFVAALASFLLASTAGAQDAAGQKPKPASGGTPQTQAPSAQSLAEQAAFAEEHGRDFDKAAELFGKAAELARSQGDVQRAGELAAARERVLARKSGIAQSGETGAGSAMQERVLALLYDITSAPDNSQSAQQSYRDIALLGASAVPWLEKAVEAPFAWEGMNIGGDPKRFVRALSMMSATESTAALDRLLSSNDPLVRRAVAQFADPERHRAQLLRALKDPAEGVREQALKSLAVSNDPRLAEVMRAAARGGAEEPLAWIERNDAAAMIQLAADSALPAELREKSLARLREVDPLPLPDESIDALLAIAGGSGTPVLRKNAMQVALRLASRPLAAEKAQRVEQELLGRLASYPMPEVVTVLLRLGGSPTLSLALDQHVRGAFQNHNELVGGVQRILSRCGPKDFSAVASAYGKCAPRGQGIGASEQVRVMLRIWLMAMVEQDLDSASIARAAAAMEPLPRRDFVQEIALAWIGRIPVGMPNAKLPVIDASFLALVRELPADKTDFLKARAISMGASGDPAVLPELVAMVSPGSGLDSYVQWAIRRVAGKDPLRWRVVIEQLLANELVRTQDLSKTFRDLVGDRQPAEILGLVKAMWKPAYAEGLAALVIESVPGKEGNAFLLENFASVPAVASDIRAGIIQRFADEFYGPATALVGTALSDNDSKVRRAAGVAFTQFRENQRVVGEYEIWKQQIERREATNADLMTMLDSDNIQVLIAATKALGALRVLAAYPKMINLLEKYPEFPELTSTVQAALDRMAQ